MIDYFLIHPHALWFTAGFLLLGSELLVLGFAGGFMLFLGVAALINGGLLYFEAIPSTWSVAIGSYAITTVVVAALLWRPLKRLQRRSDAPPEDRSSDLIGYRFRLASPLSATEPSTTRYSGISWRVELDQTQPSDQTLVAGTLVEVTAVAAGRFAVVAVDSA